MTTGEIAIMSDYWIPQVRCVRVPNTQVEGIAVDVTSVQTVWFPSIVSRSLRMLAHFRALDRDDD